jgi:DNA-binding CsgD family transcriptional regulator
MISIADIREEIDLLYHSIADPKYLVALLKLIRQKTNSVSGSLQVDDYTSMEVLGGVFQGFSDSGMVLYREHYSRINVLTQAAAKEQELFNQIFISDQLLSLRKFKSSEFYNDWVAPHTGVDYSIWLALNNKRERIVKLTLQREAKGVSYSLDNSALYLKLLQPHLRCAVHAVESLASNQQGIIKLESFGSPALVVDQNLKAIHFNQKFSHLLKQQSWITFSVNDQLVIPTISEQALRKIIHSQLNLIPLPKHGSSVHLSFGTTHFYIKAIPYIEQSESVLTLAHNPRLTLLTFTHNQRKLDFEHLQKIFDLTNAEGKTIALLFEGLSLQQISEHTQRSLHTVRSSLKTIFQKCAVSRQPELIAKIVASSAYY